MMEGKALMPDDNYTEHPAAVTCYRQFLKEIEPISRGVHLEAIDDMLHRLEFERRRKEAAD